jgi:WD40 repeat protein
MEEIAERALVLVVVFALFGFISDADAALVGIRWDSGWLVTFDPETGTLLEWHTRVGPGSFRGLTYDPVNGLLYASSQVIKDLYSIDPMSLNVQRIGKMNVPGDVSSLAYDTNAGMLYTAAVNVKGKSQLFSVNTKNASTVLIGDLPAPYVSSISFNPDDGKLYAYATYGSGSWDSPFKSSVVRIDPSNAAMTTLFETPYHTILGLAKVPGENTYYTWVNWTEHWYARVNVDDSSILTLANSDSVGVTSDAMVYRNFYVTASPIPLPASSVFFLAGLLVIVRKRAR